MQISLKNKLGLMFFIFIAIPIITLGGYSYTKTASSLQYATEQQLRELTNETASSINETIDSVDKYVKILSSDERMAKVASGDNSYSLESYNYLQKIQKENSDIIESLIVTDPTGKGIISNSSEKYDTDFSDREYVQDALKNSKGISKTILISKVTGKPIIGIAHTLNIDDKVVGTVIALVPFESISKRASKVKIGNNGYAYMIDKNGLVVFHPKSEKIAKENLLSSSSADLKALVEKAKTGETVEGYYTYDGVRKFVKFTPVNNWIVAVVADYDEYMSSAITIRRVTIIMAILSVIISVLLAYLLSIKNIINPIKHLEQLMTRAGEGDLTVRAQINTGDEIQTLGKYFNKMIEHQHNIIENVRRGAIELEAASEELAASNEEICSTTEQITNNIEKVAENAKSQSDSIIETSEVLVQLTSLVQIAQSRALTAKNNSNNTMDAAEQGRKKVKDTVIAVENISKSSIETEERLKVLEQLSKKVNGIISTINDISSQTNLLALNAAIEAARAGEHGKGFTVVAEEVRKLSEQTNVGANEISLLVNEMVVEIDKAVQAMSVGKNAVENGVAIINDTDKSFITVISAVEQIAKDIEQIVDVTKDEVASSDKIIDIINTVATITETTASNSEEVAAAAEEQSTAIENVASSAEETSAMAVSLHNLVEKFKI
ncbi:methyl-accepting chemotaxis protein [Clostridium magnum]|uniref:Methyl-accepting chemotaxis protein McpA n=1 Tax=Clostridium magnum DSM 2767 TaxID=1121326 RepID=A0A161YNZ5_9CLOT|nr:methyl-accepting chemotaxis protein [Clostridium magnum]KZL92462.1 methyl-accepting chemotaxis protein McpA [Clostridium magnum DSM 2767]SHI26567.1 methyl-accepting chemotaxis sensory transducer with Cache sensor [Clostridium magnum DSM 2767]